MPSQKTADDPTLALPMVSHELKREVECKETERVVDMREVRAQVKLILMSARRGWRGEGC